MSQHTTGIWTVYCERSPLHGEKVSAFRTHNHPTRFWTGYINSAGIGLVATSAGESQEESEANGRLIAAAPDLLEACRVTLNDFVGLMIGNTRPGSSEEEAVNLVAGMLRDAIAKAEGR